MPAAMEVIFLLKLRKRTVGSLLPSSFRALTSPSCGLCSSTLPPVVPQQRVGVRPSNRPIVTSPGWIGCPRRTTKDGLSISVGRQRPSNDRLLKVVINNLAKRYG